LLLLRELILEYADDSSKHSEDFGGEELLFICDDPLGELRSCDKTQDFTSDFDSVSMKEEALDEVVW
jgi:hypothetical protein